MTWQKHIKIKELKKSIFVFLLSSSSSLLFVASFKRGFPLISSEFHLITSATQQPPQVIQKKSDRFKFAKEDAGTYCCALRYIIVLMWS